MNLSFAASLSVAVPALPWDIKSPMSWPWRKHNWNLRPRLWARRSYLVQSYSSDAVDAGAKSNVAGHLAGDDVEGWKKFLMNDRGLSQS